MSTLALNLLVNQSYRGFAFQIVAKSAFLSAAADERGMDAPLRAIGVLSSVYYFAGR
jgi:hypothetical protein